MKDQVVLRIARELQLENSGHFDPVYFHGETMAPFLQEGDELVVQPVRWKQIVPGDIVTYRDALKFPTRRVIEVRNEIRHLVMKCDHKPPRRFFMVPAPDVLGRVVARKRGDDWLYSADEQWQEATRNALRKAQYLTAARGNRENRGSILSVVPTYIRKLRAFLWNHRPQQ